MAHSWVHCQRGYSWVGRILGLTIPTYLRSFTFWSWDVANPRTTVPFSNNLFSFFLVCTVYYGFSQSEFPLSIEEERAASEWFDSSSKDVERFTSHSFSLLVIQLLLSGFTGLCFARKMHSTSEFAKIVLSIVCVCVCVCVWGQPLFPRDLRIAQFFSFMAGGASSPSSLAPRKTLDECWWYLTWSVRRTCHVTISISEFCDSLTAATVLNLSSFKTCLGTTAFSRAKNHKSIWASWTDILSYKCVTGRDSVMALSWSWLSQAIESPPLKRISKILKWILSIVSVSWPPIRILWFSPYQSTSVNMKHTKLDWDSFSIFHFPVVPLSE